MKQNELVSIVIPSWDGERNGRTKNLLKQIKEQSYKQIEVILIEKIKPVGRARNLGTKKAKGKIIIYADDDIEFGHKKVIENIVKKINENPKYGIVGCSYIPPKNANRFQKKIAKQARMSVQIKSRDEETDEVCSMCFGMRKQVVKEIGYWNEQITSATDTEVRYLVISKGYKTIIPAKTWIYHPPPENLKKYLKKAYWYGLGSAHVTKTNRVEISSLKFLNKKTVLVYTIFRLLTIPLELILPPMKNLVEMKKVHINDFFRFDLILALGQIFSLLGVLEGFIGKKKQFRRIV